MHPQQYYQLAILMAAAKITAALPLNINLGAYSPALVVGDGEISFGGGQDVAQLMNTLEGAAVSAAGGAAAGGATEGAASNGGATITQPATTTGAAAGGEASAVVAAAAEKNLKETATDIVNTLGVEEHASLKEGNKDKRDLSGFDRALNYAEVALTKGPKIQLGTEEAGVGIIIDPAKGSIGAPAQAGAAEKKKRDVEESGRKRRTVTTVYVKGGLEGMEKREIAPEALAKRDVVEKRQPVSVGEAIDEVNVNLDARDGLTLTFVEEVEDAE